ncbi:MAG TPA: DNA-3-methyladenine glycosylase 2 family protein [Candidatus Marinimicrobia bacterium]|jgi:DNA-3-methyladenine glycosylase II|nr:DNA-3-methyladenine glycosylase 2 family protein [Candidatus Neomarinimicrobiota bacterium]HIB71182.1 DNA-3-methyladenine glycosylase 2 family protein [Candidatus Neomarinimicrobiota bacterium]
MQGERYLDVKLAVKYLSRDNDLKTLIDHFGVITLKRRRNYFKSLLRSIIHQQLSSKAAGTIENRFLELYNASRYPSPEEVLKTPAEVIQNVGISRMKTEYIRGLAKVIVDRDIRLDKLTELSNDEVGTVLKQVRGIGQWTVDMFLIFSLNRPDVFPLNDLGIQKGLMLFLGRAKYLDRESMLSYSEKWKPYRTLVSLYLWKIVDEGIDISSQKKP